MFTMSAKSFFTSEERVNWVRLIRSENVGVKTFYQLLLLYGNASDALENISDLARRGGAQKRIIPTSAEKVHEEMDRVESYGARMICANEDDYPKLLKKIADAPPVITVLGRFPEQKTVAIIGARNASFNGCSLAKTIAQNLSKVSISIASGLARGIDTSAHQGALLGGTVAVIAGGINNIYPPENSKLYWQIAESGAIVAELPFGCAPLAQHFPQRNRIIAGMSLAVAIIEAAKKSGSLITADFAHLYGRRVFAVPGSPLDPRTKGTNHLLRNGAHILESAEDIIAYLNHLDYVLRDKTQATFDYQSLLPPGEKELANYRKAFQKALSYSPTSLELIAHDLRIPVNILNVLVLELEIAGRAEKLLGNKICLKRE
jgi:DNA processing protein